MTTKPKKQSPQTLDGTVAPGEVAPASSADISASGAIMEPEAVSEVPMDHPAVESNPRAGLPAESNQIDFNDPTLDGPEAVRRQLEAQGSDAAGKPSKDEK